MGRPEVPRATRRGLLSVGPGGTSLWKTIASGGCVAALLASTPLMFLPPTCLPASAHTNSLSCRCPGFHVPILSRCRPTADAARNKTLYLGHPYSRVQMHASPPGICCIVHRLLDEVLRMPNCARNPHLLAHQSTAQSMH